VFVELKIEPVVLPGNL